jgi:hypothetical protein
MAKYKISGNGVMDTERNLCIPNSEDNRHWREYQEWLGQGNTPDPEFTQEELDQQIIMAEITQLRGDLKKALIWQFRMLLEMFNVGKAKGLWVNTDFDATIRAKAASWKTKVDRLEQLGE